MTGVASYTIACVSIDTIGTCSSVETWLTDTVVDN